jgi:hypothetical protein
MDGWGMGTKTMMEGLGVPSSIGRRLAQNGSIVSKNNRLRIVVKGVYDGDTPERRAGPEPLIRHTWPRPTLLVKSPW